MGTLCFFDDKNNLIRCTEYREKYPRAKKVSGNFCQFCGAPLTPPRLPELGDTGWFYDTHDLNRRIMGVLVGWYNQDTGKIEWLEGYHYDPDVETDAEHPWVSQYGSEAFSRFDPVDV